MTEINVTKTATAHRKRGRRPSSPFLQTIEGALSAFGPGVSPRYSEWHAVVPSGTDGERLVFRPRTANRRDESSRDLSFVGMYPLEDPDEHAAFWEDFQARVNEILQWLSDASWLDRLIQTAQRGSWLEGLTDSEWESSVERLLAFVRKFGPLDGENSWPEPTVLVSAEELSATLIQLRLALLTAVARNADDDAAFTGVVNTHWRVFAENTAIPDDWRGYVFEDEKPESNEQWWRAIKLQLALWLMEQGRIGIDWVENDRDGPLEPKAKAETIGALLLLTLAASSGAIRPPAAVETVHTCAECGRLFTGDRRRKRGDAIHDFCGPKCANRFRARAYRRRRSTDPGSQGGSL